MGKIAMNTPLVELDGDEMTRVLWQAIKEQLILPFVDLKSEYYDLGLKNRDETDDAVTLAAAKAIRQYGVGVKCATITPNKEREKEYGLKRLYKSPNATIRAYLDGTVFRAPIVVKGIDPFVRSWKAPVTVCRHAYGDVYKGVEAYIEKPAKVTLQVAYADGQEQNLVLEDFNGPGIVQGMHNYDASIESFAHAAFRYALSLEQDLWFSAKDTISKTYDHRFKDIFQAVYEKDYAQAFAEKGITYFYTLIDDAVARLMRSEGGFVWALKNYDGDVMSDMLAAGYGSLAMMSSVLTSPDDVWEYEAAHGTVQRHYYKHLKGETTSTNSVATIFAWSGALRKRGEKDGLEDLQTFANQLEKATLATIESGVMTGDLYALSSLEHKKKVDSMAFLAAIAQRLGEHYAQ